MKANYFLILLFAVVTICSVSCGGSDDPEPAKSAACDIISFKTGNDSWTISGTNISIIFQKGAVQGSLTPAIGVSDKAHVDPPSGAAQNFFTATGITYTVTAEDGTTKKVYTAKATVAIRMMDDERNHH